MLMLTKTKLKPNCLISYKIFNTVQYCIYVYIIYFILQKIKYEIYIKGIKLNSSRTSSNVFRSFFCTFYAMTELHVTASYSFIIIIKMFVSLFFVSYICHVLIRSSAIVIYDALTLEFWITNLIVVYNIHYYTSDLSDRMMAQQHNIADLYTINNYLRPRIEIVFQSFLRFDFRKIFCLSLYCII